MDEVGLKKKGLPPPTLMKAKQTPHTAAAITGNNSELRQSVCSLGTVFKKQSIFLSLFY